VKRRAFTAPPADLRCKQDIKLRDGSGAQCMRGAVVDGMCRQHAAMARDKFCAYCGGNDETPPDHTQDCTRTHGVEGMRMLEHWPILYAILRPAILSGNEAVRHHAERLCEVLEGGQRAFLRELLDRQPSTEPAVRVVHGAAQVLADFAQTAPGRLPQRVQDAIAVVTAGVGGNDAA
jgi:hypothetical protein